MYRHADITRSVWIEAHATDVTRREKERDRVALEMALLLINAHAQYGLDSQIQKHAWNSTHNSVIVFMGEKE